MWQTIKNAFSDKSIRSKIFATFGLLLAFRIGCWIPLPGIVPDFYANQFGGTGDNNTIVQLLSMMSGGSMQYLTFFALGILPFINSFIIMQLLTLIIPPLERLSKQGDEGREKITMITRYVAIVLALVQAIGIVVAHKEYIDPMFGEKDGWLTAIMLIALLIAGSTIVMWLGERITQLGIGNGTSLIIFSGILSSFGLSLVNTIPQIQADANKLWNLFGYILVVLFLFAFIVFVDGGERKIKVNYAKQVKGNKMYGGQSTFIPIKVNSSGVMPIIFASSFMTIPMMIFGFAGVYQLYDVLLSGQRHVAMAVGRVVVLLSRNVGVDNLLCILLCSDTVQSARRSEKPATVRRLYPRYQKRYAHRGKRCARI